MNGDGKAGRGVRGPPSSYWQQQLVPASSFFQYPPELISSSTRLTSKVQNQARGVSPQPTGNPDAEERLYARTRTPAPRGEAGYLHKAPLPHPPQCGHTPPAARGKPGEENPAFHAVRPRRADVERLGPPPREARGPHRSPGLRAEERAVRTKEGIPEIRPRGPPQAGLPTPAKTLEETGTMRSRLPRHPRPESDRGWRRHLPSHPREHTPPDPGAAVSLPQPRRANARPSPPLPRPSSPRPPRSPAPAPVRGSASRSRSETQVQGAAVPAPPHNMASLGFRNGAREIQQGPLNIHERPRGSRLGRRGGEGGKERVGEGAEARDGDVHCARRPVARGEGAPPRCCQEGQSRRPAPGRPAPPPSALREATEPPGNARMTTAPLRSRRSLSLRSPDPTCDPS
ncbi:basic salivary proline-rich protein 2-like [Physeter macrocephalus]|uniref:Basic salivary proline-rich protein 2-like n=1 Tax=Physeter macrocephalus TaxID=9755 RepID=A0A9W2WLD2_PHYMC|nr:basic salivary proline-rich protein 2-like [Physeter catodon]